MLMKSKLLVYPSFNIAKKFSIQNCFHSFQFAASTSSFTKSCFVALHSIFSISEISLQTQIMMKQQIPFPQRVVDIDQNCMSTIH
ncbi:hypothetical protein BpHYR1_046055 [Brachionus plicatilis]|uniref:Uncharacterized protein n=1 Tax=Brachionus plicatilis TaxID=10195 RepID=A0A3M7SYH4_BRAPC|nr:hypothetical protein BpHYR1_046055 [Brachionus plicatilis]